MDKNIVPYVESLIFASEAAISSNEIKSTLEQQLDIPIANKTMNNALNSLVERYQDPQFGIELININGGFQFATKGAFHAGVAAILKQTNKKRLTSAAMETLAIIAYKQPLSKIEMERIRGVNCDYTVQKLLEKELISISGRGDGPGKPILYSTSEKFMDYFGLKSIQDLPKLKEFINEENVIGEPMSTDENILIVPSDGIIS